MSRLPQVTARQMLAALQRAGFVTKRVKGSHHYLVHGSDPSRRTTWRCIPAIYRHAMCRIFSSKRGSRATSS
jgi:predicted RNA binding protein YcfA (HicA-like mRNA interferase family)